MPKTPKSTTSRVASRLSMRKLPISVVKKRDMGLSWTIMSSSRKKMLLLRS